MIFTAETAYWQRKGNPQPFVIELGCGHRETGLLEASRLDNSRGRTAKFILNVLRACRSYCFHGTSSAAKIRQPSYILDGNYLRSNGGNLAAYLLSLKSREGGQYYYEKIVRYLQRVLPQFADFVLIPMPGNSRYTELKWCTTDSQQTFGPQELSDGALRFMALGALLLQPPSNTTNTIVIDGPEEALHPQTLDVLVDMVREASLHCKIILATQSLALLKAFGAENLLVLELDPQRQATQFYKLSTEQLQQRLARYRLGEDEQEA